MKKTTIELNDDVYRELKIHLAERGITMKEFIESALKTALAADRHLRLRRRVKFPIIESTDPNHRVTFDDVQRIMNELGEEEALEQARLSGR